MRAGAQRRRTKQEIKQQKEQEEQKMQEMEAKVNGYDQMLQKRQEDAVLLG